MHRREPDRTEIVSLTKRLSANVSVWVEPTDIPWDGCEPLEENAEGFDILIEARITVKGQTFKACDSLGGCWILPDSAGLVWLDESIKDCTHEAISHLKAEIKRVATGADVQTAQHRADIARRIKL